MPPTVLSDRPVPRLLRQARRQLMSSGSLPPDMILPELSRSWLRSWNAGLLPCGRSPGVPHASAAQLARALRDEDLAALVRVPGIGRKTAERMVVELRDKLEFIVTGPAATPARSGGARPGGGRAWGWSARSGMPAPGGVGLCEKANKVTVLP